VPANIENPAKSKIESFDRKTFFFDFLHEPESIQPIETPKSQSINNHFDLRLSVLILQ